MSVAVRARNGVAMGMDKSGTYQLPATNTWGKVLGFVARSGYPDTNLVNDACHMTGGPVRGTVSFQGQLNAVIGTRQFQAYVNGSPIGSAVNEDTLGTVSGVTLYPDDELELWGYSSLGIGRTVNPGATVTFIYFTPD